MLQSHASYSRCGLGSEATDRIVALTREEISKRLNEGRFAVLYGAKITGGGSGGETTVKICAERTLLKRILLLREARRLSKTG